MRFILDTNILIPLEDSQIPLSESLANFVRLANENGHVLLYHPASIDDINEDKDLERRTKTLHRLNQYTRLDYRPECPWNIEITKRNDIADNEILYALYINAAHALITEDRGIHDNARERGLADRVYTIQTAEDLLRRLHERHAVELPNIEEVSLYQLTTELNGEFFDSLRSGYPDFDDWFIVKAQEGRKAWVSREQDERIAGICIYAHQTNEWVTDEIMLKGESLKLSTFKVGEASRGRKIGELFLKAAFRYATANSLEHIFIHGDVERHYFLFEMLESFGFEKVGYHPGSNNRDAVYVKNHPVERPFLEDLPAFEYLRRFFPHYLDGINISKYVVPIRPEYHNVLFPDFENPYDDQMMLFSKTHNNAAGNAIKLAYLCNAQTSNIEPGSLVFFYRSTDYKMITSVGVVESYQTLESAEEIAALVKRRTVYSMEEIIKMSGKPTRVMLFWLINHLRNPIKYEELIERGVFTKRPPQSISRIDDDKYKKIIEP